MSPMWHLRRERTILTLKPKDTCHDFIYSVVRQLLKTVVIGTWMYWSRKLKSNFFSMVVAMN